MITRDRVKSSVSRQLQLTDTVQNIALYTCKLNVHKNLQTDAVQICMATLPNPNRVKQIPKKCFTVSSSISFADTETESVSTAACSCYCNLAAFVAGIKLGGVVLLHFLCVWGVLCAEVVTESITLDVLNQIGGEKTPESVEVWLPWNSLFCYCPSWMCWGYVVLACLEGWIWLVGRMSLLIIYAR